MEVVDLAQSILPEEQFELAEETARMLASSRTRRIAAADRLTALVAPPPKRPLYYAQHEMEMLPRWTRDGIRYLGDYVDVLVKHLAFQLSGDAGVAQRSMGPNINVIERGTPSEICYSDWPPEALQFLPLPTWKARLQTSKRQEGAQVHIEGGRFDSVRDYGAREKNQGDYELRSKLRMPL